MAKNVQSNAVRNAYQLGKRAGINARNNPGDDRAVHPTCPFIVKGDVDCAEAWVRAFNKYRSGALPATATAEQRAA